MKEFKIGQRVRVLNNAEAKSWYLDDYFGKEFIVTEVDQCDGLTRYESMNIPPEACELVEDVEKQIDFSEMVSALVKPGEDILASMTPQDADLLHVTVGVAGEAGELLDAVKKAVIYRKPIDLENVVEELGDLEFYMERVRRILGITREQTIQANIDKLSVRYAGLKYTDKAAQTRADKAEEPAKEYCDGCNVLCCTGCNGD